MPAEGLARQKAWPDAKFYKVPCKCGCDNHIDFFVEVDEFNVSTSFCSTTKTKYWYQTFDIDYNEPWLWLNIKQLANDLINRFTIAWRGLVHGYVETESCVILTPQQCVNFAEALKLANIEFEALVDARMKEHEAMCDDLRVKRDAFKKSKKLKKAEDEVARDKS